MIELKLPYLLQKSWPKSYKFGRSKLQPATSTYVSLQENINVWSQVTEPFTHLLVTQEKQHSRIV